MPKWQKEDEMTVVETPTELISKLALSIFVICIIGIFRVPFFSLVTIGLMLIFLGFSFTEIQSPFLGFYFKKGKLVGQIEPGWHLIMPVIWSIRKKSQAIVGHQTEEETMYVKGKTAIGVKIACFWQVVNLEKAIEIDDEDFKRKVIALMTSETKSAIGTRSFANLIKDKRKVETEVKTAIQTEIERNGYNVTTFEIVDFNEQVESEAAKIVKTGEAEAKIAGKKAQAIKDGVGDSWQGTLAIFGQEIGRGIAAKIKK